MVARGDLGLEIPLERVPRVQKEMLRRARARGVPVIVATQVLESMRTESRPTRAEVSDAASAVDESADAIMLSGETAAGAYPVRAVEVLDAIIRDAEAVAPAAPGHVQCPASTACRHNRALCEAAVTLAQAGRQRHRCRDARREDGSRVLAALRPGARESSRPRTGQKSRAGSCSIAAVTPIVTSLGDSVDATGASVGQQLLARGLLQAGDEVVFVQRPRRIASRPASNFIKLHRSRVGRWVGGSVGRWVA